MINETKKFLKALDPVNDKFTFQTFDDQEKAHGKKDERLSRILHGTIDQHYETLQALNKKGAGIYVTVNATDLKGRKAENVTGIRAIFVDLDGAPLGPAKEPKPHIIVESSPKRWHVYWRVEDMPLDAFKRAQQKQIKRLNSDKSIHDLPRVLRLPGFTHQKGKPFKTRIVSIWNGDAYPAEQFINTEKETKKTKTSRAKNMPPVDIKEVEAALNVIPADDYNTWLEIGAALYKEFGEEKGWPLFDRWSRKSEKYNKKGCEEKWEGFDNFSKFNVGTIFHYANKAEPTWRELDDIPEGATIEDFVSYLPGNTYVYTPTGQHWTARPVNAFLPKQQVKDKYVKATDFLDKYRRVQSMTWAPGNPELIPDRIARAEGGWIEKPDTVALNTYQPPRPVAGDASRATRWLNHIHKLFPDNAQHLINWFAHRVQHPGDKCNHGLIIGGEQGIGKDMILKPVRHAVGTWNCVNIAPAQIMSSFNSYVKSVICQVDEARDLGDTRHYDFYEHLKTLTTAPPDILQCNEKHVNPYGITNCTGVVITTNHRTGAVYLPPGDRRFYVAWSVRNREEFTPSYFHDLESYYVNGGYGHVAAYLREHDLKKWNAKAAPPQTEAWRDIVEANLPVEDAEFAEAITNLENPDALTLAQILKVATNSFGNWLEDRRNSKRIAPRLESCGYISVRNVESGGTNRWQYRVNGRTKESAIYAKSSLTVPARVSAAKVLIRKLQSDSSET